MTHPLNRIKNSGYSRDITRDDRVNRSLPAGPDISIHAPERSEPHKLRRANERRWKNGGAGRTNCEIDKINFEDRWSKDCGEGLFNFLSERLLLSDWFRLENRMRQREK